MALSKRKLMNNKYDALLMQIEENIDFQNYNQTSFTSKLNDLYQQTLQ